MIDLKVVGQIVYTDKVHCAINGITNGVFQLMFSVIIFMPADMSEFNIFCISWPNVT